MTNLDRFNIAYANMLTDGYKPIADAPMSEKLFLIIPGQDMEVAGTKGIDSQFYDWRGNKVFPCLWR